MLQNDTTAFISKISALLQEIDKLKESVDASAWKAEYDDIYERLQDISDIAEGNIIVAQEQFQDLPISKYDNFNAFIYNTDINMVNVKKGNNERTKMLRAKRKTQNCPDCGGPLTILDGSVVCNNCGYTSDIKAATPNTRASSDCSKHTYKQLDAITGTKKPPANIVKIIPYLTLWLTDMHYIRDWLISTNRLTQWMEKYISITEENIDITFFNRVIDRNPDNMPDHELYKLFTDELYLLLENCKRYSRIKSSNMEGLPPEKILEIFIDYIRHGCICNIPSQESSGSFRSIMNAHYSKMFRIPDINERYRYNGEIYEIGAYVNMLSLIYDVTPEMLEYAKARESESHELSDTLAKAEAQQNQHLQQQHTQHSPGASRQSQLEPAKVNTPFTKVSSNTVQIKCILEQKIFGRSLTVPGLMFNFNDIYEQSDNVPKRYNYTQEYIYVIHETYHVPYASMSAQDKNAIIQLILQFNEYYKREACKRTGKECNAPLFCCTFTCIIQQLPYFQQYADALKFMPIKDKGTSSHIKSEWFKFACKNADLIMPYNNSSVNISAIMSSCASSAIPSDDEIEPADDEFDEEEDHLMF